MTQHTTHKPSSWSICAVENPDKQAGIATNYHYYKKRQGTYTKCSLPFLQSSFQFFLRQTSIAITIKISSQTKDSSELGKTHLPRSRDTSPWELGSMTDTWQTVHVASLMESCTSLLLILWKSAVKLEKPSNSASPPKKAVLLFCYATLPHNHFEREAASISFSINIPSSTHCLHFKFVLAQPLSSHWNGTKKK